MTKSTTTRRRLLVGAAAAATAAALPPLAFGQKKYGPGVTDTEIKVGQTIAYSGPASAYGQIGRAETAYFKYLNDRGGINGRKINFISIDDGYSPPKAVEMTRRLVEQDEVALMFGMLGTPLNMATRGYLNAKKVPTLFVAAGSSNFANPEKFPWTIGFQPTLTVEGGFFAKQILALQGSAKIGVLFQDDDFGKELLSGLKIGLGDKASMVIAAESFQPSDPTVDSQIIALKGAGADTLMLFAYAKQAAQAIRKSSDLGWRPTIFLSNSSASIGATLTPAGLDRSTGVVSSRYLKDTSEPGIEKDSAYQEWLTWMNRYLPDGNKLDFLNVYGYSVAQTLVHVLGQARDNLTRENVMAQATSIKGLRLPMLVNGVAIDTDPAHYAPVRQLQLIRFDGTRWVPFGDLIGG